MFLYNACMFTVFNRLADKSVNLLLADLPYGTTDNEWDNKIDLELFKAQVYRVTKPTGNILLFGQQPFLTELMLAFKGNFRYELIYEKSNALGFLNANNAPLRAHENILVIKPKGGKAKQCTYNPQKTQGNPYQRINEPSRIGSNYSGGNSIILNKNDGNRHPTSIIKANNSAHTDLISPHPTAKPYSLINNLILQYSNQCDTVFDPCFGSGVSAVASMLAGRNYVGAELDSVYYNNAKKWLREVESAGQFVQTKTEAKALHLQLKLFA